MRRPVLYLAGAIRDGVVDDHAWRHEVIQRVGERATVLSPLAGKAYDPETKRWTAAFGTAEPVAKYIFNHDLWCVRTADVIIANLSALKDGYPNIGTLVEFGAAAALGKLIYTYVGEGYVGHQNQAMYRLHPFIEIPSTIVFDDRGKWLAYVDAQLDVLSGRKPEFLG